MNEFIPTRRIHCRTLQGILWISGGLSTSSHLRVAEFKRHVFALAQGRLRDICRKPSTKPKQNSSLNVSTPPFGPSIRTNF